MNVLHALGYSMIIATSKRDVDVIWTQYHQSVELVLWQGDYSGKACMENSTCVHTDPRIPVPPPNSTHLNIPLW